MCILPSEHTNILCVVRQTHTLTHNKKGHSVIWVQCELGFFSITLCAMSTHDDCFVTRCGASIAAATFVLPRLMLLLNVNAFWRQSLRCALLFASYLECRCQSNPQKRHKIVNCVIFTAYYIICTSKANFFPPPVVCHRSIFAAIFSLISAEHSETLTRNTMASSRVYVNIGGLLEFRFYIDVCGRIFSSAWNWIKMWKNNTFFSSSLCTKWTLRALYASQKRYIYDLKNIWRLFIILCLVWSAWY